MPQIFYAPPPESEPCVVTKNGADRQAHILERRPGEVYVHYAHTDKRLDEWVSEMTVRVVSTANSNGHEHARAGPDAPDAPLIGASVSAGLARSNGIGTRKRKRSASTDALEADDGGADMSASRGMRMSEEEYDIEHHKRITAKRNFDKVIFGRWQIKTWYFSPYPLTESETDEHGPVSTPGPSGLHAGSSISAGRIPGVSRSHLRSHGRTSDLLAGGLGRSHGAGEKSVLWVCDRCFKYMAEGQSWELHVRKCRSKHPPGRKVYQRGAHIIWEVDGAKEKLYCQNLSLFGKLFIDIKTLFFDCDNFLFYILTDADSQRDHVLGFFSKEKISYDDYNLACIVVLPPYQKKGYGMLLIEFSYELSRRAGKLGTPERPLSDLGLRSYLTYWIATLIRYFRRLLSVLPLGTGKLVTTGNFHTPDTDSFSPPIREAEEVNGQVKAKKKKSTKGWDGEVVDPALKNAFVPEEQDPMFSTYRTLETATNADGSATTHAVVRCTLADIAQATGLRVEDAAFALNECGLLVRAAPIDDETRDKEKEKDRDRDVDEMHTQGHTPADTTVDSGHCIVISREMVEAVVRERGVKRMCMDLAHVLL